MYRENKLNELRPSNNFRNFEAWTESQKTVFELLQGLAQQVFDCRDVIANTEKPFAEPYLLFLWGEPSRGKRMARCSILNWYWR